MDESPTPIDLASLDQEEARLRERLGKIALMKKLAHELGYSLNSAVGPVQAATSQQPTATVRFRFPEARIPEPTPESHSFDGTIASLIRCYRTDERSPYFKLKYSIQNNYTGMLNKISTDFGEHRVGDLSADRVMGFYGQWAEGGKISMGHALGAKLRLLASFGATVLNDDDCIRFSSIMRNIRFPVAEPRLVVMTAAHATALRAKCHDLGWGSIALAQAFQFELKMRQADVIGEWVSLSDPIPSTVTWGNEKWVRGLKWSDIDSKMILRFVTFDRFKRKKLNEFDLTTLPMVMQELDKLVLMPTGGPMIIHEATGRPYSSNEFRRKWRLAATKAGIPDNVRNSDSVRAQKDDDAKEQPSGVTRLVKK
jgi:hypothetical protein